MKKNDISLEPLRNAARSLQEAIKLHQNISENKEVDELMRDGVIKRFDYTFELAWKLLKRILFLYEDIKEITIKDVFRIAAKHGLIENTQLWFDCHNARNLAAHTYDEVAAEDTYNKALLFSPEADLLVRTLGQRFEA